MKNRLLSFVLLLALMLTTLLSGCAGSAERAWKAGQKKLAEENYSEAAAEFEKAGSFRDAELLLLYARSWLALERGDCEEAESGFLELEDFQDSSLMATYARACRQKALAQTAFLSDDAQQAANASVEAYELFAQLALFRDSDELAAECRNQLYDKANEWMAEGRYEEASSGFAALGDWQDCAMLDIYCRAAALEGKGSWIEAAERYSEIPDFLDSSQRAEAARGEAYRLAAELRDRGDYEGAAAAFAELGSYRDAEAQRDLSVVSLIREQLRSGSYAEALEKLNGLSDLSVFPAVDTDAAATQETFLNSFLNVWMTAHAHIMNAFFASNLLQPYLEPGSELDTRIRADLETMDASPLNGGFTFYGAEVTDLLRLDDSFTAARVHASASYYGADGSVTDEENLLVLLDLSRGNPVVAAVLPV